MDYSWSYIIDLFMEGVFLGFGLSLIITFMVSLFRNEKLKKFHNSFLQQAIRFIRIFGIIYFLYILFLTITNFKRIIGFFDDKDELYRTIFFLSRYTLIIICTQLFWIKKVNKSKDLKGLLILLILALGLFAPYIIERFVFTMSYFQNDFIPVSIEKNELANKIKLHALLFLIEKIAIFALLVFATWLISKRTSKQIN